MMRLIMIVLSLLYLLSCPVVADEPVMDFRQFGPGKLDCQHNPDNHECIKLRARREKPYVAAAPLRMVAPTPAVHGVPTHKPLPRSSPHKPLHPPHKPLHPATSRAFDHSFGGN